MTSFTNWNLDQLSKTARASYDEKCDFSASPTKATLNNPTQKKHKKIQRSQAKSLLTKTPKEFHDILEYQNETKKTSHMLETNNFKHHDPNLCVCDSCNCGRHFCKLHNVKPDMSKSSNYKQSYPKKSVIPNIVNRSSEYQKLKGDHIGMDSIYHKIYLGGKGDQIQRPKPEDLLKTGGPSPNLTSYGSGFPGYKGENQYVKPTDKYVRAEFPIRAKSTYAKSFENRTAPKPITQKIPDNLKSTNLWLGKTSYGNFYAQPNPEDYAKKVKNVEKLEQNPRFGRQYQTTYKNSFIPDSNHDPEAKIQSVCPSKKILQAKIKGSLNDKKDLFNENSDYKAFNPSYHSISTSKHWYV